MSVNKGNHFTHIGFEISLLIKGVDGILEILGGLLLLYFTPSRINNLVKLLTQHELSEDPKDYVANSLLSIAGHFSIDAQNFGIIYLFSHGLIKLIIILMLWAKKLWAYPLSIGSIFLFILYQIYRYIISPSLLLIILTLFDILMIILTYIEYQRMKNSEIKE